MGVSFSGQPASFPCGSDDRSTTQLLQLGTRVTDKTGGVWVYVKAGAAIAQYDAVRFNGSTLGYDDVRPTSAANQVVLGVADAAFASGEYGFVQVAGIATCKVVAATAAGSPLVTNGTAGTLALADATGFGNVGVAVALVTGVAAGSAIALAR